MSSSAAFPDIEEVLPHVGPAILLSRVVDHDEKRTVCTTFADRARLYRDEEGRIPSWVGIEMMAQCVAAHGGLRSRAKGEAPRLGFLLGSRRLELSSESLPADRELEVSASHLFGDVRMVAFSCALRDRSTGGTLIEASLSAYVPGDDELDRMGLRR